MNGKKALGIPCMLAAIVIGLSSVSAAGERGAPTKRVIWTDEPVVIDLTNVQKPRKYFQKMWDSSVYPIGNGRLGCVTYGEPRKETIQFNEDSLWVGNEDCTGGYQPFGEVYVEMAHQEFSDYRRELDISRAVQTITYKSGGVKYKREYFSSHPAQVMVFRFSADKKASLSGTISMGNQHQIPITADNETLTMEGDTSKFWLWQLHRDNPRRLLGAREYASDKNIDLDFEAQLRVLNEGGTLKTIDNTIVFENCNSLTLLLAADTNYLNRRDKGWRGAHPHERVSGQIAAAEKRAYAELLDEHVADYQRLYNRLSIDLGHTPAAVTEFPIPERVKAYSEQVRGQAGLAVDRDLESLLYQYARYLMISCSRPGEGALPANLQGLWLINKYPAWRCDYHTDINLQMNYWFTAPANLAECFVPVAEWIDSIREVRKEETRKVLDVKRGWLMRSENGVFGGSTYYFQKGDSAWLCQNLWDHYAFTQDREYLERYAYPVMKEISEFWVDHLKELPGGVLVAPDGRSPEHGPEKSDGVSYDQQLCWDLFSNTIEASEVLDVDTDYRKELMAKRKKLLGPKIGKWGQLQEWMEDIDDPNDRHRHVNHMIAVYPGRQVHPTTTPKLAEAAKVSLIARGSGGPGWSQAWKTCIYARLLDGERAYASLSGLVASRIYGNLWASHPPFQIDCNFGYAAGVNEMLVQSHMGVIHLLPALPKAWSEGSVKGMRVRGGYELDMEWKAGKLATVTVRGVSNTDPKCTIKYGKRTKVLTVAKGKTRVVSLPAVTVMGVANPAGLVDTSSSPHVKLRSIPMTDVKWTDGFWADRFELCRKSMLPTLHNTLLDPKCSAQLNRIKFTAGLCDRNPGGVNWADGDCYKWIEAMAHAYSVQKDAELDRLMDRWIAIIAKAQDEDGFISTNIGHDNSKRMQIPYQHQLYNMGHLLTAACIHHRATGKDNFLAIANKVADYLYGEFKPNPPRLVHFPWNPSVYMGLIEMYRTTRNRNCLEVAEIMIDNRGTKPGGHHTNGGTDQTQDRVPLRKETEAVGHAVCGMYLYCGAADLYAETGDREILAALERIWESVSLRKMDLTGSVAMGGGKSTRGDPVHEAFGPDYAQPNEYNETCANIGNGMFNYRMLSLSGDAKYADIMELVAYNCLNVSVDLQGENWFYCNPLSWDGNPGKGHHTGLRWRTNNCYCCPPSVVRTTAKLHNWMYSLSDDGLWVHLYGGNRLEATLKDGSPVKLTQQTDYPWDGKVILTVKEAGDKAFAIRLRIPEWTEKAGLKVNGKEFTGAVEPGAYAKISRTWKTHDVIELDLSMPVRLMAAHPKVAKLHNKVAVMRGPLVYCLELPICEGGQKTWHDGVLLPENVELKPEHRRDFLGGVTVLKGKALTFKGRDQFVKDNAGAAAPTTPIDPHDRLYRPFTPRSLKHPDEGIVEISLIPYYTWANRGLSMMEVWIPLAR